MALKPLITILVGPPGSGKSSWAEGYLEAHNHREDLVYINQDTQGKEGHMELFTKAIAEGKDVVVDRMNFSRKQRNRYLEPARKKKYDTRIVVFHVPFQTCLERVLARKDHPTIKTEEDANNAVYFFFKNYGRVKDKEADEVIRQGWVSPAGKDTTKVIVCDLDGTLANVEHRRHFVRPPEPVEVHAHGIVEIENPPPKFKPNWKAFFDGMVDDSVNEWCRAILRSLSDTYRVVYATGRPADYKEYTQMWLSENALRFPGSELFMRLAGDFRRDDDVKEIILEFEIKTRWDVLFVLDDRQQVVDMWRKHGYTVLQCDKGDF